MRTKVKEKIMAKPVKFGSIDAAIWAVRGLIESPKSLLLVKKEGFPYGQIRIEKDPTSSLEKIEELKKILCAYGEEWGYVIGGGGSGEITFFRRLSK
ncbi:hypothetical protein ACFL13_02375 [Patescibacteria group bacterium]